MRGLFVKCYIARQKAYKMAEIPDLGSEHGLLAGISSAITAIVTWVFTRRKNAADVTKSEIENLELAVKLWRETAENQQKLQQAHIKQLEHQINNMRTQINGLYAKVRDQDRIISKYATELIRLGADPDELAKEDEEPLNDPTDEANR